MNVVIPCGGLGSRFYEAGYSLPKPLILLQGKPILVHLLESLSIQSGDNVVIPYAARLDYYNFRDVIMRHSRLPITFVPIFGQTRGACETVLAASHAIRKDEPLAVVDCDTFYRHDILATLRESECGMLFWMRQKGSNPIYSYLDTTDDGHIIDIWEKNRVTDKANTGCYFWKLAHQGLRSMTTTLGTLHKEPYMSLAVKHSIGDAIPFKGFQLREEDVVCLGTPAHLMFHGSRKTGGKIFCFDLDHTLVTATTRGDYVNVSPNPRNIAFLRAVYAAGHRVIIHTARRMLTHKGDVAAVIADIKDITVASLKRLGIPYDELVFGKPYADFYIDDKAIAADSNLEAATGVYFTVEAPRQHHSLTMTPETVEKRGDLAGEYHWYATAPASVSKMLPTMYAPSDSEAIHLERLEALPMSKLMVRKLLTPEHIRQVVKSLRVFHMAHHGEEPLSREDAVQFLWFDKVDIRLAQNREWFEINFRDAGYSLDSFLEDSIVPAQTLLRHQGCVTTMHGDPVMSNILMTLEGDLRFIDMRGRIGDRLTKQGIDLYDYAKLMQSLRGYDFCVAGVPVDAEYCRSLASALLEDCPYPKDTLNAAVNLLAFSMLPLHSDSPERCQRFIKDLLTV